MKSGEKAFQGQFLGSLSIYVPLENCFVLDSNVYSSIAGVILTEVSTSDQSKISISVNSKHCL